MRQPLLVSGRRAPDSTGVTSRPWSGLFILLCNFAPNNGAMKKRLLVFLFIGFFFLLLTYSAGAQCSICTKTTQQLGEKPARGMNGGILYLAFFPMAIVGVIGFRWWKHNKEA